MKLAIEILARKVENKTDKVNHKMKNRPKLNHSTYHDSQRTTLHGENRKISYAS